MSKIEAALRRAAPADAPSVLFDAARDEIRTRLVSINDLSDDACRRIIRRYTAGVGGNFVNWLAAGTVSCRSLEARYATAENAYIEIQDDHPGMLRDFAKLSGAEPETADYRYAQVEARRIQAEVSKMSGVFIISLVGTLENVSLDYIPWLGAISKRLGNDNMRYVDIHGEADIEHATQFHWALEREAALYPEPEPLMKAGADAAVGFIGALLRADA
ncbi:MAG TPA: hypothetical protein VGW40_15180 [Allosphingosinicella sp.]|nr:hypothetical protein [Allosphingosinicella sp.]